MKTLRLFLTLVGLLQCFAPAHASSPVRGGVFLTAAPSTSSDGTTITATGQTIIDASGNTWTLVNDTVQLLQVFKNGVLFDFSSHVTGVLWYGGVIYHWNSNTPNAWYSAGALTWSAVAGDPRGAIPVINSTLTATGTVGVAFSYTITATNTPTSYSTTGTLPTGLSRTGAIISGTPTTTTGSPWSFTIDCANATGSAADQTLVVTINAAPVASTQFVAAHLMVKIGKDAGNSRALSDYKTQLTQLYAAGVDCAIVYWDDFAQPSADFWSAGTAYSVGDFARSQYGSNYTDFECIQANTGQTPGATVNTYTAYWVPSNLCYTQALKASEELVAAGTPAAKIGWGVLGLQDTVGVDTEMLDYIIRKKSSTGLFLDTSGRFIISGYNNSWNSTHTGYLTSGGCTFAYWPDQWAGSYPNYATDAAAAGAVGHFRFARGNVWTEAQFEASSAAEKAAAASAGIGFMPAVHPGYIGNQNSSEPNFQMYAGGSLADVIAQITWCRLNDVPGYQLVTANDFQESSHTVDFGGGESVSGPSGATNWTDSIILSHAGFRPVMKHHATWYKTGTEPTITADSAVICYPLCPGNWADYSSLSGAEKTALDSWLPANAIPYSGGAANPRGYAALRFARISTHDNYDDRIEAWVTVTATTEVTLSCGSGPTDSRTVGAGAHLFTILGATTEATSYGTRNRFTSAQWDNKPHLTMTRSGGSVVVLDADAPQFIRDQRHPVPGGANRLAWVMLP